MKIFLMVGYTSGNYHTFREATVQVSNGSHVGMASKSQIFEFLHNSLNFGAFFVVLIYKDHHSAEPAKALAQQSQHHKSKQ